MQQNQEIAVHGKKRGWLANIMLSPEIGILIPLLLLCIVTTIFNPKFISLNNISVILVYATFMAIVSIGQSIVVMSGEIDLSVGLNSGFCGVIFALCAVKAGMGPVESILIAMVAGGLVGCLNGFLVAKYGLVNFITTLATMYICWGLQVTLAEGKPVSPLPDYYLDFAVLKPLSLSWPFFIMLGIFVIMEVMIRFTNIGRRIQAVGGNKESALMAGINVMKVKWGVYILSGVLAAISGILTAISMGSAFYESGVGMEFKTITACAVGGISLSGGSGSILGLGIGILLVNVLNNCLQMLKVESNTQLVIIGVVLVGAVLLDNLKKKVQARNL